MDNDLWHNDCSHLLPVNRCEDPDYESARMAAVDKGIHTNIGPDKKREVEPNFFFMMNCLLYSRLETGYPSNRDYYDEDVNMYLANLLTSFMNPEYHRRTRKYLSRYDSDLFEKVKDSTDVRLKYTIYKTNADFLLISIGIFRNATASRPDSVPIFHNSEEAYMGRGKAYYQFAYTYSQSMFRKPTAVSDVLEKLSRGFEHYVEILSHMRGEYFNILDRLGDGEIYHLERSIDKFKSDQELKTLQDNFLDVYSAYMKSKDPKLKQELKNIVSSIQKIDQSFRFVIDD